MDETERAQALARRYHAEFVDLKNFNIQHELFKSVPVDMMFRYNFVPLEQHDGRLAIAVSDPSKLMVLDEISGLLGTRLVTRVATLSQITDLLKKTEQSQRVLDEASEGLAFDVLSADDNTDENISIERLTGEDDISPIIRLVDTTIFTALERRASDIHLETFDDSLLVKYRIDGVLQQAMAPIAREHHQTILSRIKVMSRARYCRAPRTAGRAFPGALQGPADRLSACRSCRRCMAKTPCCACSIRSRCRRSSRS